MTSRDLYDWVAALSQLTEALRRARDPLFTKKFFTSEGVYYYSQHEPSEALRVEERSRSVDKFRSTTIEGKAAVPFTSAVPNSSLCSHCGSAVSSWSKGWQSIVSFASLDKKPDTIQQDLTFKEISESAELGCHLCHWRLRVLERYDTSNLERIRSCIYSFWKSESNGAILQLGSSLSSQGMSLEYVLVDGQVPFKNTGLLLCEAEALIDDDMRDNTAKSHLRNPTSFPWELTQSWLDACENSHIFCKAKEARGSFLPTRLLHLPEMSNPQGNLSVIETKEMPRNIHYATLSHRWGQSPFHKFIETCSQEYFKDIPVHQIPQLFQDAIRIAQRLGLRYIWIDCFCIKQGSLQDWIFESAQMDQVYRFSFINLAASNSSCSEESVFYTRNSRDIEPCIIQTKWDLDEKGSAKRWMVYEPDSLYEQNIEQKPLAERAWVVQEIVLAPRVLHLGSSQVFWECDSLRACETFPLGIPGLSKTKPSVNPISLQYDVRRGTNHGLYRYQVWANVVNMYSQRKLTKVTDDRLVALSGVAKAIGAPLDDYLAGLWREDLSYQLLWEAAGPGTRAPLVKNSYQAPSWSWASYNGAVKYRFREYTNDAQAELLIKIIDARTEKMDHDPTGRVSSGYVQVEAPLAIASLRRKASDSSSESDIPDINGCPGRHTIEDLETLKIDLAKVGDSLYLMPVELKMAKGERHLLVVGLILRVSPDRQANAFQRVGYFTVTNGIRKNDMSDFFKSFRDLERRPRVSAVAPPKETQTAAAIVFGFPTYSFKMI